MAQPNPLLSTGRAPDNSLSVQLHPLVLLTISDYITRHTLRQFKGPVIGAIIGRQDGRQVTMEHAFECKLTSQDDNATVDAAWFTERLEQYKDVHKAPALDLVALFTLGPTTGPQPYHVPFLQHVQELTSSDGIMLLLFHPEMVDELAGGKLPISLYESFQEPAGEQQQMMFRELGFEVETGEAEMIGVDFVAKGGGNATAVQPAQTASAASTSSTKGKGKAKASEEETNGTFSSSILSPEDEELIASLTAKSNAIKMLNQRINLIRSYLTQLSPSYLTDTTSTTAPPESTNHPLLRSISSLLARVPLLAPPSSTPAQGSSLESAGQKEKEDVHLTSLLASLTKSVAEAQNMGQRFATVQKEKQTRGGGMFGGGRGGGMGRFMGDEGIMADSGNYA